MICWSFKISEDFMDLLLFYEVAEFPRGFDQKL